GVYLSCARRREKQAARAVAGKVLDGDEDRVQKVIELPEHSTAIVRQTTVSELNVRKSSRPSPVTSRTTTDSPGTFGPPRSIVHATPGASAAPPLIGETPLSAGSCRYIGQSLPTAYASVRGFSPASARRAAAPLKTAACTNSRRDREGSCGPGLFKPFSAYF